MPSAERGNLYDIMRRAIVFIDQHDGMLSLEELAAKMAMSPTYFRRLFSRWVGVKPKKYQQYLTLNQGKALLSERFTLLDTVTQAKVLGSSRLRDLSLRWEGITLDEFARSTEDVMISWGWFDSPFGELLAMGTARGLCGLAFVAEIGREKALQDMLQRWPSVRYQQQPEAVATWVESAFSETGQTPLCLIGAPFQIKVWEALMHIPLGYVTTYSIIAEVIGHHHAARAVGTAVGRNPVAWLIPCHRVLCKSGGLGGYHWGLPVKRAMLALEAARVDVSDLVDKAN